MSLPDLINDMATAIAEAKQQLAKVRDDIETKEAEKQRIAQSPPHADDLIACFERGLAQANGVFLDGLSAHLTDKNLSQGDQADYIKRSAASLLMIGTPKGPEYVGQSASSLPFSGLGAQQRPIDVAAVTFFLGDIIRAALPDLIKRVCPNAEKGMRQADRASAIREIDSALTQLRATESQLAAQISAAAQAVRSR